MAPATMRPGHGHDMDSGQESATMPQPRSLNVRRWPFVALSIVFLAFLAIDLANIAGHLDEAGRCLAVDFKLYRDATSRWLAGDGFYGTFQLAAPYRAWGNPSILYPPTLLLLFAPFTVLPAILWWIVPIAIVAWVVIWLKPGPPAWPVLALCIWFPTTTEVIWAGNPVMWCVAALAAAMRWDWPGVLVALKPSLGPFALFGCWHKSWWIGAALLVAVSVPFGGLWFDYLQVMLNVRERNGLLYSLNQVPTMFIPIVAWLGSVRVHGDLRLRVAPPRVGPGWLSRVRSRRVPSPVWIVAIRSNDTTPTQSSPGRLGTESTNMT